MMIAKLTKEGLSRVLNGQIGMTFMVDSVTIGGDGIRRIAHVRDYRFPDQDRNDGRKFQIWSIGPEGYQLVTP